MRLVVAYNVPVTAVAKIKAVTVVTLGPRCNVSFPCRPIHLGGKERVALLVMAVVVDHGDAARVLALREACADGAHAIAAANKFEAVKCDIVGGLEIETDLPPGVATRQRDTKRLVLVLLGVDNDRIVVGTTILLRELETSLVLAAEEIDLRPGTRGGDRGPSRHRR